MRWLDLSGIWEEEVRPFSHTIALFHTLFHLPLARNGLIACMASFFPSNVS